MLAALKANLFSTGGNDLIPFATGPWGRPFYASTGESDYGCVYYDVIVMVGRQL